MIKLVAFDVAGTTVEEHAAVYTALEDAVVAAGGSPGTSDIQTWMGAGKREAITGLFRASEGFEPDTAVVDATFDDFRARLDASYRAVPPTPMPGVVETFEALHAAGIKVALTTGFDRDVVDRLLAVLGWGNPLLDAVVCIDDVAAGRPAPYMIFRAMEATGVHSVGDVLVVGDTVRDLEAGMNAGAGQVVGVLTGDVPVDVLSVSPIRTSSTVWPIFPHCWDCPLGCSKLSKSASRCQAAYPTDDIRSIRKSRSVALSVSSNACR